MGNLSCIELMVIRSHSKIILCPVNSIIILNINIKGTTLNSSILILAGGLIIVHRFIGERGKPHLLSHS